MTPSGSRSMPFGLSQTPFRSFWKRRTTRLRMLLGAFASRRRERLQTSPDIVTPWSPSLAHRSHLQQCCERALDAYTIEDAIFWHSEVINELSVEIYSLESRPGFDANNERAIADLMELQSRHGAILHRLTGIVARNEQFVWQPQSLCKK